MKTINNKIFSKTSNIYYGSSFSCISSSQIFWFKDHFMLLKIIEVSKEVSFIWVIIFIVLWIQTEKILEYLIALSNPFFSLLQIHSTEEDNNVKHSWVPLPWFV